MIDLTLGISPLQRTVVMVRGFEDQMPFALSKALNEAAKVTQDRLIEDTWPSHVQARNQQFLRFALGRRPAVMATKRSLRIEINDERADGRGNLSKHARGGTRSNPKGKDLAVPSQSLQARRGTKGVPSGLRPKNLPNAFRKGDVLYQRTGKYQKAGSRGAKRAGAAKGKGHDGRGLKLMYVLKPRVPIRADVPFEADFRMAMAAEFKRQFPIQMRAAIATVRRK